MPTYCYDSNAIDATLAADALAAAFWPFIQNEPNTSAVVIRNSPLLPARCAARFLSRSLTPNNTWVTNLVCNYDFAIAKSQNEVGCIITSKKKIVLTLHLI